ncbi:MAG: hypothetical protein PVI75_01390 [Gammaproteobacteria bacterium]|jgi:hypothetical protein
MLIPRNTVQTPIYKQKNVAFHGIQGYNLEVLDSILKLGICSKIDAQKYSVETTSNGFGLNGSEKISLSVGKSGFDSSYTQSGITFIISTSGLFLSKGFGEQHIPFERFINHVPIQKISGILIERKKLGLCLSKLSLNISIWNIKCAKIAIKNIKSYLFSKCKYIFDDKMALKILKEAEKIRAQSLNYFAKDKALLNKKKALIRNLSHQLHEAFKNYFKSKVDITLLDVLLDILPNKLAIYDSKTGKKMASNIKELAGKVKYVNRIDLLIYNHEKKIQKLKKKTKCFCCFSFFFKNGLQVLNMKNKVLQYLRNDLLFNVTTFLEAFSNTNVKYPATSKFLKSVFKIEKEPLLKNYKM